MKILLLILCVLLLSCQLPIEMDNHNSTDNPIQLENVILFDGFINSSTNIILNEFDFPNEIIKIQFEFSDPEIFDGLVVYYTNTTSEAFNISYYAPHFIIIKNIDMTNSQYIRLETEFENDPNYDGREIACKIIWIRQ